MYYNYYDDWLASDAPGLQKWAEELNKQYQRTTQKATPGEIRRLLLELNQRATPKRAKRYQKILEKVTKQPVNPRNLFLLYGQLNVLLKAWSAEDRQNPMKRRVGL